MKVSAVIPAAPPPAKTPSPEPRPDAFNASWITLPAAILDVTAAALVVNHAAITTDMQPVLWLIAFALHLFLLTTYHIGHATRSRSRAIFVLAALLFGSLLGLILWDHSQPHLAWTGTQLAETAFAPLLVVAAACVTLPGFAILYHYLVLGRIRRIVQGEEAPEAPPEEAAAAPEGAETNAPNQ